MLCLRHVIVKLLELTTTELNGNKVIFMDKKNETVTISKEEYDSLLEDQHMLQCLQGAGVDNWAGYDLAIEMMNEEVDEND